MVCALAAGGAFAADLPSGSSVPGAPAGLVRPEPQPPMGDVFRLPQIPLPAAPSPDDAAPLLQLQRVEFHGNTAVPDADLQAAAASYVGRGISAAGIEALRQQLTRLYVGRGYVNSGLVLRQVRVDDGVVAFDVVEGRLAAIQLRGMQRLEEAYLTQPLRHGSDGPLNLDLLRERFQLLLGDPLFERLNARLLPGAQPGEAVLDIDVTRSVPYQFTVFANNYRPVSLGAGALGARGWVRNLSGRGDVLEASLQQPVDGGGDLRGSIAWRVPLNYRGTQLSLAWERGDASLVKEAVQALDITSRLTSREIGLSQVLDETLSRKFSLGLNAVQRANQTWLLGEPFSFTAGEPDGVTRERLWRFWQEIALRSETQVLALRSTFTRGRSNLQQTGAGVLPSRYRLWLGQVQVASQLAHNGAQLVVRGAVQRSPDRLLALDGLAVGGVNTVRGYRENQMVRDQGAVINIELEWPLLRDGEYGLRIVAVPFYDVGRGRNHGEPATTLRSAGVTTRLTWQGLSVDLTLAKRLRPPASAQGTGANLQDKGVHLQLAYRF